MSSKLKNIFKIILIIVSLQIIRIAVRRVLLLFIPITELSLNILNMVIFIIYTYLLVKYCKKNKIDLRVFKVNNKNAYLLLISIFIILFIINLLLNKFSMNNIFKILYGTITLPIFEELLFRGYIWSRLLKMFKNEMYVYIITTLLFSIYSVFYIDSAILLKVFSFGLIIFKIVIGLLFGLITGFVRYKTKNTFSSMIVSSIMNMVSK